MPRRSDYVALMALVLFGGAISGAEEPRATHAVKMEVRDWVRLQGNGFVVLTMAAPASHGAVTGRIRYSSIGGPACERLISASTSPGDPTSPGLSLQLRIAAIAPELGRSRRHTTLSETPRAIVRNIRSCATDAGGVVLTYILIRDEVAVPEGHERRVLVVYLTITDSS